MADCAANATESSSRPPRTVARSSNHKREKPARVRYVPHHISAFGADPQPDPCTPRTRLWILLLLAAALALDCAVYLASASELAANLGAVLCFPAALALFFVLLDLCRAGSPAAPADLAQPLVGKAERVEVRVEDGERHVRAIAVDSLRKLAVANQLKASI